jgi:hypothetical protein
LNEQIRAKVAAMRHNAQKRGIDADEERDPRLAQLAADTEDLASVLLAVLEFHPADAHECPENFEGSRDTAWQRTCPTLLVAAEKIGIEVPEIEVAP